MHNLDMTSRASSDIQWDWRDIGAVITLVGAGTFTIMMALRVATVYGSLDIDSGLTSPALYAASAGVYGLLILGVYWFAIRKSGWGAVGFRQPPWWTLAITPALLVAELFGMVAINNITAYLSGETFENPQVEALTSGGSITTQSFVFLFILIAILAPIAEELFFRGMLYPVWRRNWRRNVAIFATAGIFAALHFVPMIFPALFFVGLILGLLREWSNSIIPCIVLHMMQNGIVLIGMSIYLSSSV